MVQVLRICGSYSNNITQYCTTSVGAVTIEYGKNCNNNLDGFAILQYCAGSLLEICWFQGWEFAHRSFAQIKRATVSDSLRSLKTIEQLWANRSGRSYQKSDRERIAQVAHDKCATVSDSLRWLMINEQISDLIKKNLAKILFFSRFYICFLI